MQVWGLNSYSKYAIQFGLFEKQFWVSSAPGNLAEVIKNTFWRNPLSTKASKNSHREGSIEHEITVKKKKENHKTPKGKKVLAKSNIQRHKILE